MKTTTKTALTVTFSVFPRLANGDLCNGSEATFNGVSVGLITREIEWTRNAGMSERYTAKIAGYRVELWDEKEERVFATLAEARTFVRAFARKPVAAV